MENTKKSLMTSVVALLLCFSMLLGTTYAWFTDTATSKGNIVQSGNLDAEMYWSDTLLAADSDAWQNAEGVPIFTYDNWEPGYTDVKYIKVKNAGNLAFQWRLSIEAQGNVTNLADVIDVYYINPVSETVTTLSGKTTAGVLSNVINTYKYTNGVLLPFGEVSTEYTTGETILAIALHMHEDAGNEYKNKSIGDGFAVRLIATQFNYEGDGFNNKYDEAPEWPENVTVGGNSASATVETTSDNRVSAAVSLLSSDSVIGAEVPAGVKLNPGVTKLTLNVSDVANSQANVTLSETEASLSVDVHIDGVAEDNDVVMAIDIKELLPVGLNMGNYRFYHVENGQTVAMTLLAEGAVAQHNNYEYDPATGDVVLYLKSFSEVAMIAEPAKWEGKRDYSWYDASKTELTIANADQLAALSAIVGGMDGQTQDSFSGKTVKLVADINLGDKESENNADIIFYPIGYNSDDGKYEKTGVAVSTGFYSFMGTFDGNGHTVSNFYQNTWEMKGDHNWYSPEEQYYRDGMGLFGRVYGGIVKNLTVKNFSSDGEIATTGVIAAYADGATFENIAIFNCNPRVYNIGNGGIVGCVGWYAKDAGLKTTFTNITVDNSNKISALWGSYDVACGGIVGQYYPTSGQSSAEYPVNAGIDFVNCHVSAQMDVYNDVCANYQYYAYRYAGMLIGSVRENETIDGHVYPKMDGISAEGCTVHFGTWNDYYYCELVANSLASYTHDHQFSRLEQVKAVNGTTITPLEGEAFTVPASGRYNYVVVNGEHATENATCYHFVDGKVHNHDDYNGDGVEDYETVNGESIRVENNRHIYLEFNNLVTGYGWGVTSKGLTDFEGVTNMDITQGDHEKSVKKFEGKLNALTTDRVYTVDEIFAYIEDCGVEVINGAVNVTITNLDENGNVIATFTRGEKWNEGTISFENTGHITITIQDYYFCEATEINVTISTRVAEEKFDVVMNNGDFLHRVGNSGTVALDKLFKAKDGVTVGTVSVTVEAVNGTGASGTYSNNAIQFSGTGVVKVTITDNDYCTPTELYLEVVDAVNATSAMSATSNNVVLLQNCGFSSLEVSGGYTLYGNGFTLTCSSDGYAKDRTYSFVELKGGTLDNVQIVVPNFSHAIMYEKNKTENGNPSNTDSSGTTRYYNIRSAVAVSANSKITNSYISGGRAAIYLMSGELMVENSTIYGGAVANIQTEASSHLILEDVTLIQKPIKANVNDTSKTVMGFSVVMMCDTTGKGSPVTLKGYLHQYAWAHEGYTKYVPSDGQSAVSDVLEKTDFIHSITYSDGTTADSVNLGFAYMPDGTTVTKADNMSDLRSQVEREQMPYEATAVNVVAAIYTYKNTNGTDDAVKTEPTYTSTTQGIVIPNVQYSETNENRVFTTTYDATKASWKSTLKVDVDAGAYSFNFAKLLAQKYGTNLSYTVKTEDGTVVDKNAVITLNSAISNVYILTITDNQIYDKNGNLTGKTVEITYIFELQSTKTSLPAPTWTSETLNGIPYIVVDSKGGDWNCAVPVLDGLKVKYWSKKQSKEIELDLSTVVSAAGLSAGLQNGSNNTITITVADEYTLTITTTGFKTNDNGKPVVADGKLYFTVSSSSNYVSTNTTDRTVSISYMFTDANNSDSLSLSTSMNVVYANYKSKQYKYSDFCDGTLTEASCVTPDTLITLADGTQVRVDSLTGNEELLVWNMETGKFDKAPIMFVDSEAEAEYEIIKLYFSDGTEVKVIYEHGFWDYDLNKYVYLDANAADYIGHTFAKQNGESLEKVQLVDVVIETELTTAWSPVTVGHLCYFVNGMLSMPGGVGGLFNIFEVDPETMTYDYEQIEKDIETYGLYTYEELNAICPLSEEMFNAAGGAYLKISIGKGNLTIQELIDMINRYSKYI